MNKFLGVPRVENLWPNLYINYTRGKSQFKIHLVRNNIKTAGAVFSTYNNSVYITL